MTYVISDLHGYPLGKFKMLLDKADLTLLQWSRCWKNCMICVNM